MALSGNASRALQQVEAGLYMLYGASYFTEDEWIKIDGLIHKGQYVFTDGPAQQNFLEDELLSFDDFNTGHTTPANTSFGTVKGGNTERAASSFGILETLAETSMEPSVEAPSDDVSAKKYELFDFSETTTPSSAGASSVGTQKLSNDISDFTERKTPSPISVVNADQEKWSNGLSEFANTTDRLAESKVPTPESTIEHAEAVVESTIGLVHEPISKPGLQPSATAVEPTPQFTAAPFEPTPQRSAACIELSPQPTAEPFEPPKREAKAIPKEGGLAYYTQAQLDELKAFNAGLTKAGEKSKPKLKRGENHYEEPAREEYGHEEPTRYEPPQSVPVSQEGSHEPDWAMALSPTTTEHETRIQSWASEVDAQDLEVASPAPQKIVSPIKKAALIEKFVEIHGRTPINVNDIAQPNNPNFRTLDQRSVSRASNKISIKSNGKTVPPSLKRGPGNPELNVATGTILIAQSGFIAKSNIQIGVQPGDKIRIIKHVSGITHIGENLRNGLKGQFLESVFKRAPGQNASTLIEQQRIIASRGQKAPSMASIGPEGMNAADWEAESDVSKARAPPVKPTGAGGLSTSRYAVLDDLAIEQQSQVEQLARLEVGKLVDEKIAQILAGNNRTGVKAPIKEPLKVVTPKTETCWWWKTPGKDCRFAAHECRDAHYFLPPALVEAANLRMGKPTWGALADQLPPPGPPYSTSKTGLKTCWYWENEKCTNSPENCKYLHEHSSAGVAEKPQHGGGWKKRPTMQNWRSGDAGGSFDMGEESVWGEEGEGSGHGQGELVLEEVKGNGELGSGEWGGSGAVGIGESASDDWGTSSNTYKAPHVRALEERASIAINGW